MMTEGGGGGKIGKKARDKEGGEQEGKEVASGICAYLKVGCGSERYDM